MPQKDRLHVVIENAAQKLSAADIGQMSSVSQDPSLEMVGISADLQHVDVMIRFKEQNVRIFQAFHRIVRIASQIRADAGLFPAVADSVTHGFCRIMGDAHGIDLHVPDRDLLIGSHRDKSLRVNLLKLWHPADRLYGPSCRIDRHIRFFGDHGQAVNMV